MCVSLADSRSNWTSLLIAIVQKFVHYQKHKSYIQYLIILLLPESKVMSISNKDLPEPQVKVEHIKDGFHVHKIGNRFSRFERPAKLFHHPLPRHWLAIAELSSKLSNHTRTVVQHTAINVLSNFSKSVCA